jgi:hypothetical protein
MTDKDIKAYYFIHLGTLEPNMESAINQVAAKIYDEMNTAPFHVKVWDLMKYLFVRIKCLVTKKK